MARSLQIDWGDGLVTGRFVAATGSTGILLAHGAGVGQDAPWIVHVRDGLASAGFPVLTFNYPYMEGGKKAPNRPSILLAAHSAAAAALKERVGRIVLAGKSMGGRMGSHLAAEGESVAGLVFYGYPLVGIGKQEPRDVSHLGDVKAPMLFVQGTRDRLAPLELITPFTKRFPMMSLHIVEDGDHSYKVPKRAGRELPEVLDEVVAVTTEWLISSVNSRPI